MGPRQTALYTEIADLYKPVASKTSAQTYTLEYSDVPCQFVPTPNIDEKGGAAKLKQNSVMTSDGLHFHTSQEIGDEWVVHIKSGSVRQAGKWKRCIGAGRELPYRALADEFYVIDQKALTVGQIV